MITAATLQEYYQQAKRWQSEMEFYEVETHVLHQLLDKYVDGIHTNAQISQLGALLNDLFEWSATDKVADETLDTQLQSLAGMINDDAAYADDRTVHNQELLALQMENLQIEYRQLKADIYHLVSSFFIVQN